MGAVVVCFFVCESQNRTLEEIDTMYILGVNPIKGKHWQPPEGEGSPSLNSTYLKPGARGIKKNEVGVPTEERRESTGPQSGGIFQAPEA
jgi:SP family sugar:H+ symporter-like MFS transporter